ncbi:MAG: LamB/YcsF family protein, partial [Chthoniobacterales bacterium]
MKVLLNCDLGEGEPAETTAALLEVIDLANVACGGHAGDEKTMRRVVCAALERGVQTGAHPGWPDRESFGRAGAEVSAPELTRLLADQVGALRRVAAAEGAPIGHVKLHVALYHLCDERTDLAEACVDWMDSELERVPLIVGAGGLLHAVAEARGVPLLREIFAERGYADEARLLPRGRPGALIGDPDQAAQRIGAWRSTGCLPVGAGRPWLVEAETVCVHA